MTSKYKLPHLEQYKEICPEYFIPRNNTLFMSQAALGVFRLFTGLLMDTTYSFSTKILIHASVLTWILFFRAYLATSCFTITQQSSVHHPHSHSSTVSEFSLEKTIWGICFSPSFVTLSFHSLCTASHLCTMYAL